MVHIWYVQYRFQSPSSFKYFTGRWQLTLRKKFDWRLVPTKLTNQTASSRSLRTHCCYPPSCPTSYPAAELSCFIDKFPKMVKRCCYGTCDTDSRYKERLQCSNNSSVEFHPFPKPATKLEKCRRWIKLCGRPHHQLNEDILRQHSKAKHFYVCSKVFFISYSLLRQF